MYSRLTDKQWAKVEPFIVLPRRADGRGRPWQNARAVVDGILYVLHSGCAWNQLPRSEYPPYQTCHRWFQRLIDDAILSKLLMALVKEQGRDLSECFVDGTFVAAKKGGDGVGWGHKGYGTTIMLIVDKHGRPLAAFVASASVHESQLVKPTLAARWVEKMPLCLVGDKAYDSDDLDALLAGQGVEMIAPHRKKRVKAATQDGRKLRRIKKRWKIERTNAWIKNYRRLGQRWEWYSQNLLGFVHLACIALYLKNV